jgi:hypothetical protein
MVLIKVPTNFGIFDKDLTDDLKYKFDDPKMLKAYLEASEQPAETAKTPLMLNTLMRQATVRHVTDKRQSVKSPLTTEEEGDPSARSGTYLSIKIPDDKN